MIFVSILIEGCFSPSLIPLQLGFGLSEGLLSLSEAYIPERVAVCGGPDFASVMRKPGAEYKLKRKDGGNVKTGVCAPD
jgi:hypothetical protein